MEAFRKDRDWSQSQISGLVDTGMFSSKTQTGPLAQCFDPQKTANQRAEGEVVNHDVVYLRCLRIVAVQVVLAVAVEKVKEASQSVFPRLQILN